MVLTPLDVNDPQPRRDDLRFCGDYKAFRKADKAWNERERSRRAKVAKLEAASDHDAGRQEHAERAEQVPASGAYPAAPAVAHPKPRGKAPKVGGVACTWDTQKGSWLDAAGKEPDFEALKAEALRAAWRRRQRAVHELRLEAAAQIDGSLVRDMESKQQALYTTDDEVFVTGSKRLSADMHTLVSDAPGHEAFLAKLGELGGEFEYVVTEPQKKKTCKCHRCYGQSCHRCRRSEGYYLRLRRGSAYWEAAYTMIGTLETPGPFYHVFGWNPFQSKMEHGDFKHHLRRHLQAEVDKLWEDRWSECKDRVEFRNFY